MAVSQALAVNDEALFAEADGPLGRLGKSPKSPGDAIQSDAKFDLFTHLTNRLDADGAGYHDALFDVVELQGTAGAEPPSSVKRGRTLGGVAMRGLSRHCAIAGD